MPDVSLPCEKCKYHRIVFAPSLCIVRCTRRHQDVIFYLLPSWHVQKAISPEETQDCFEPLRMPRPWERDWCILNEDDGYHD